MIHLYYKDSQYPLSDGQTVLEALEAGGLTPPASCRNGVCQTCKCKGEGALPPESQVGLKETEKAQGYFLPCIAKPTSDLTIFDDDSLAKHQVEVLAVNHVSDDIAEIKLNMPDGFNYRPGQYLQVHKSAEFIRTYSLASLKDEPLTLHIRKVPGGAVSEWLHQLPIGYNLDIKGPMGGCFYQSGDFNQPLLLIGTGTGLAPLYGIVRDALAQGHQGPIYLFHGVEQAKSLYKHQDLQALAAQYPQLHYTPCLSAEEAEGCMHGMVLDIVFKQHKALSGYRIYLAGHPMMVKTANKKAYLYGAKLSEIYTDPFG